MILEQKIIWSTNIFSALFPIFFLEILRIFYFFSKSFCSAIVWSMECQNS